MDNETPEYRPTRQGIISWFAGFASLAVLAMICIPSCYASREAGYQREAKNKLKMIALGMQNYDAYYHTGLFPSGGIFRKDGTPLHGWQTHIMPFTEGSYWYERIDFDLPWDDPTQIDLFMQYGPRLYLDPSIGETKTPDGLPVMHFAANEWILHRNSETRWSDITDSENTFLVGDTFGGFRPMGEPFQWRDPTEPLKSSRRQFGHVSRRVTQMALVDGSVVALNPTIDAKVLENYSGPQKLRPAPELVARPTEPYRLATHEYWRILRAGKGNSFSKGGKRVELKLSPDERVLDADFDGEISETKAETTTWQGEFQTFTKSRPIEHVRVSGTLLVSELEPFLQIPTLKRLTIREATIEGDKEAALRSASKPVEVD